MKTRKSIYLIIFCFVTLLAQAQIRDRVSVDLTDIRLTKIQEFDQVNCNSIHTLSKEGEPELPFYRVSYVLPIDAKITDVTFLSKEKQLFKRDIYIYPAQPPLPVGYAKDINFIQPDKKIYDSDAPYPGKLYDIESDDIVQGYHVVTLRIYPFEYIPKSRILNYYPDLEYTVEYEVGANREIIRPETQSILRADLCKTFIKHLVKNALDVEKFGSTTRTLSNRRTVAQQNVSGLRSQNVSVLDETVPDYIIIACDSLKSAFQPLADWKTKKGIFTIIVTTEKINANYQGSDLTEKIRNYLLDAYNKWGDGLYVLLGGDINIVPSRMVYGVPASGSSNHLVTYPTDKYYSTATSWILNNNNIFNGSDSQSYINFLGRVPVSNTQEVSTIVSKIIAYEKADNLGNLDYLKNNLYADAYLEIDNNRLYNFFHSYIKSYKVAVPNHINNRYICDNADCTGNTSKYSLSGSECHNGPFNQGDVELTRDNFLSCLSTGANLGVGKFHFIYHMDHSGSSGMGTSGKDKGQGINKLDMYNLTNGNSYQVLFSSGCHPANFQYDCVAKHYLMNPNGGGVVFIGNTDVGYQFEYPQFQSFLQSMYATGQYNISSAFYKALSYNYLNRRWRLHLLGDPEMQVWTDVPQILNASITSLPAVLTGQQNVTISVSGLAASDTARVCIWKDTEVYETRKVVNGINHTFTVTPETAGTMYVTIAAYNYFPKEDSITVTTSTIPNPIIQSANFVDNGTNSSIGNGNGRNDAGETIALQVELKNNGINTANNLTATLTATSSYITVLNNSAGFGSIASGNTAIGQFLYEIDKDSPEILANAENPVQFQLEIQDASNTVWTRTFNIDVFATDLQQRNKIIDNINGNAVTFNIELQNMGQAPATGLTAVLKANNTVASSRSYPTIGQFETQTAANTFQFTIPQGYTATNTPLTLDITDAYGRTWTFNFTLAKPDNISGLDFMGGESNITLTWNTLAGAGGYNIYRCDVGAGDTESGNYVKLNTAPVSFSFYDDKGLDILTKYYYKITAVSPSGMEGDAVRILTWTSYPVKEPFPVKMDTETSRADCSIQVADIDYDGKKEIFTAVSSRTPSTASLVALRHDGSELFDIDNNITSRSGLATVSLSIESTPAIGDLYADGEHQIVSLTMQSVVPNLISCHSFKPDGNIPNRPELLWQKTLDTNAFYLRGACLANIDNSSDGSLEIVTKDIACNSICIFDNKGTLLSSFGSACNNWSVSSVAVADLDEDGDMEIIAGNYDGVYIWQHDGTPFTQNPFFTSHGYRFDSSPVICDLDRDGEKEILIVARDLNQTISTIFAIKLNATLVPGWGSQTVPVYNTFSSHDISVGDLNGDGNLDVVCVGNGYLKVWNNQGIKILDVFKSDFLSTSAYTIGYNTPILADVDGDSICEIVFAQGNSNKIHAIRLDGTEALGFPLSVEKEIGNASVAVADIDGDGKSEIIAVSGGDKIYVWETNGNPNRIEWGSERKYRRIQEAVSKNNYSIRYGLEFKYGNMR